MHTSDDMRLLKEYASGRSDEAFAALVSRHVNLVYSAALRSVNNPSQAEEITQSVFVTLARKSRGLKDGTVLSGWLYQTARLTASNFIRAESRRQRREQEAHSQSIVIDQEPEIWARVRPLLEEAMAELSERDRNAIVLRFFEEKPLKEVGGALGTSEDAAKMRVTRALDKMRDFFNRNGITVSAGVLAKTISGNSIQAAPIGLAATVASQAVQASSVSLTTLTLVKGTIHMMSSAKISIAVGLGAAAIIGWQAHQLATQKRAVKVLQQQAAQTAHQIETIPAVEAEITRLQNQTASYTKTMEDAQRNLAKARAHASAALATKTAATAAAAAAKANPFGEIFKDPAMLEAMRPQQMVTAKMMYGPLVKKLNLSAEQADKFYGIIVDNGINSLKAMQSGNPAAIRSNSHSLQADLQTFLGDDGYTQYQNFTKNEMADQTLLMTMKNDFVDDPLSNSQQSQLLQAMESARQSVTANNSARIAAANPLDKTAAMAQAMQAQEQMNQDVLQQAAAFLSPGQLQTLGTSQSNIIAMQKSMAPMMQKMFGGTASASP